jgi:hypothetical protein
MKTQIIITRKPTANDKSRFITFTFNSIESARAFIARFGFENRIVDIL